MLLVWAIACAALIVVETMTLDFTCLTLAAGCLVGLAAAAAGASFLLQCVAVAVSAVAGLILMAPVLRRKLTPRDTPNANEALVGAEATVVEAIRPPAQGRVKLDGVVWQAVSNREIPEGTVVIVTELEGNRLTVLSRNEVLPSKAVSQPLPQPGQEAVLPPPSQQEML
jgi:membrane protein implicated in regulation of membrane protease activity